MTAPPSPTRQLAARISAMDAGCRFIDFLARRFTYRDCAAWHEEIATGRLLVNGALAAAEQPLASGDEVTYHPLPFAEPAVATDYTVLHEDADLLVLDKPAPLPCHPGGRYFRHTLWALLRERHDLARPLFANRLDRETSGVIVVARHRDAARHLATQFAMQQIDKEYLVVVEGEFPHRESTATGWLAPDLKSAVRKKMRFFQAQPPLAAKACTTGFTRLATQNGLTLLMARPLTGRCHQIRATLLALGFPVVGDKLYGVDETLFLRFIDDQLTAADGERLRLPRQALHASRLTFTHPATAARLSYSAPLPAMLHSLLAP